MHGAMEGGEWGETQREKVWEETGWGRTERGDGRDKEKGILRGEEMGEETGRSQVK